MIKLSSHEKTYFKFEGRHSRYPKSVIAVPINYIKGIRKIEINFITNIIMIEFDADLITKLLIHETQVLNIGSLLDPNYEINK